MEPTTIIIKTARMAKSFSSAATFTLLSACAGNDSPSNVGAPGKPTTPSTRTLEAGAALLQSRPPVDALNAYLDGIHFYNGHPDVQMEAHHYCAVLNEPPMARPTHPSHRVRTHGNRVPLFRSPIRL